MTVSTMKAATNGAASYGDAARAVEHEVAAAKAKQKLANLLGLDPESIERARVVGQGSSASADLYLAGGVTITFQSLREMASHRLLALEVAACTRTAPPNLTPAKAIEAVAALSTFAEHIATQTVDQASVDLGISFLQSAAVQVVDMRDQQAKWEAFCALERRKPLHEARSGSFTVAEASVVLLDPDGTRYVRAGWFQAHARHEDPKISALEVNQRMTRVGWFRRGKHGRIHARKPGGGAQLVKPFFVVPKAGRSAGASWCIPLVCA